MNPEWMMWVIDNMPYALLKEMNASRQWDAEWRDKRMIELTADRDELLKVLKNIRDIAPSGAWDDTFHQTPSWWRARVRNMHDAADEALQRRPR